MDARRERRPSMGPCGSAGAYRKPNVRLLFNDVDEAFNAFDARVQGAPAFAHVLLLANADVAAVQHQDSVVRSRGTSRGVCCHGGAGAATTNASFLVRTCRVHIG